MSPSSRRNCDEGELFFLGMHICESPAFAWRRLVTVAVGRTDRFIHTHTHWSMDQYVYYRYTVDTACSNLRFKYQDYVEFEGNAIHNYSCRLPIMICSILQTKFNNNYVHSMFLEVLPYGLMV